MGIKSSKKYSREKRKAGIDFYITMPLETSTTKKYSEKHEMARKNSKNRP